ncbi:MAG: hypothetical protein HYS13_21395 [Planctomycetia bacterium]|nr:hypothetical protein [Planctomycetia bacterium]
MYTIDSLPRRIRCRTGLVSTPLVVLAILAAAASPARAQDAFTARQIRFDESQLKELGGGSGEAGLNKLGEQGYQLQLVTSVLETAAAGYHYFRRAPQFEGKQPQFEFKRLDAVAVTELGNKSFNDGLAKLEVEGWDLIAVTVNAAGGVGYHYFQRARQP